MSDDELVVQVVVEFLRPRRLSVCRTFFRLRLTRSTRPAGMTPDMGQNTTLDIRQVLLKRDERQIDLFRRARPFSLPKSPRDEESEICQLSQSGFIRRFVKHSLKQVRRNICVINLFNEMPTARKRSTSTFRAQGDWIV